MLRNNLIYIHVIDNFLGFLDTGGGGLTFLFRKPELSPILKIKYLNKEDELKHLPKKVILFVGNDYWKNKIYKFDYLKKKFNFIKKIPKHLKHYKMFNKKQNYSLLDINFIGIKTKFLFDTGATLTKNKRNSGISFLDGIIFDKIKSDYKVIKNYDDDGSPCIIIPKIIIFDKTIKNVKFLRREKNSFLQWFSGQTGVKHIGAIGGNVLKHFTIICDFKNKLFYI